jgi:hypothetical protein
MAGGGSVARDSEEKRADSEKEREQRLERDEKRILENGLRKNFP